jgi:hypothetical protein
MENENKLFGTLFNSIDLKSEEHLDIILSTMDKDHSIYYLVEAIKSAHRKGVFTIGETEVISKAIRTISKES